MNVHEYQAKALLRQYGVPLAQGMPAFTVEAAVEAAQRLPGPVWVVKAQIHAGGRGKGGGVKLVQSAAEARDVAAGLAHRRTRHADGRLEAEVAHRDVERGQHRLYRAAQQRNGHRECGGVAADGFAGWRGEQV